MGSSALATHSASAAWQASVDALFAEQAELDRDSQRQSEAWAALRQRRDADPALVALIADMQCPDRMLRLDDVASAWRDAPIAAPSRRLVVTMDQPGAILVSAVRTDLVWSAQSRITIGAVGASSATLRGWVELSKPAGLDLGTPAISVVMTPLWPSSRGPADPRVALRVNNTATSDLISKGNSLGSWSSPSVPAQAKVSADISVSTGSRSNLPMGGFIPGNDEEIARTLRTPLSIEEHGPLVRWDLGTVALPATASRARHSVGESQVRVEIDEWALIPAVSMQPLRRMRVVLGSTPLMPGELSLNDDAGRIIASEATPWRAAGSTIDLRAGLDERVVCDEPAPWTIPADEQTSNRRSEGSFRRIWNLSDAPITLPLYLTRPLSRTKELTISLDPRTSTGSSDIQPGLLRWQITIPARSSITHALGWRMAVSGGLDFAALSGSR